MNIWHCSHCAQLMHVESGVEFERCWNCGVITDFSLQQTHAEKLRDFTGAAIQVVLWPVETTLNFLLRPFSSCARLAPVAKLALISAAPTMVVMLLISKVVQTSVTGEPEIDYVRLLNLFLQT